MAVNNSLQKKAATDLMAFEYESNGEKVKLSSATVRNYLVSGGGNVTDQEVMMFLTLCRYSRCNPFLREVYLIKYGNSPATMVTSKDLFLKRANRNPNYAGKKAGIIVMNKESGEIDEREGTVYVRDSEDLIGGWAKVYIKGHKEPEYASVSFEEYAGRKSDGALNNQWATKPATMIRKVALVQALREAFPEDFGGLYSPEELGDRAAAVLDETIPTQPIEMPTEPPKAAPKDPAPAPEEPEEIPF